VTKAASRTEDLFVTLATEYYVAGRFASMAGCRRRRVSVEK
jgi:hypothetical protein